MLFRQNITFKKRQLYLIVRTKRGWLFGEEKQALHRKICEVARTVFCWFCDKNEFIDKHYLFYFKVLKECLNYHFYNLLISSDKYINKYF